MIENAVAITIDVRVIGRNVDLKREIVDCEVVATRLGRQVDDSDHDFGVGTGIEDTAGGNPFGIRGDRTGRCLCQQCSFRCIPDVSPP